MSFGVTFWLYELLWFVSSWKFSSFDGEYWYWFYWDAWCWRGRSVGRTGWRELLLLPTCGFWFLW